MKKKFKKIGLILFVLVSFVNVTAQDENNPWSVSFGVNAIDVRSYTDDFGKIIEDYIGPKEWSDNTLASISRISVGRYLKKGFSVELAGSLNKVKTIVVKEDADALYWSVDAFVKYDLNNLFGNTGWFDPYIGLGASFQELDEVRDVTASGGYGFNAWFNENVGLNFQSVYKHGFESNGRDIFQHSLGVVLRFGGKDTDGDGVYDKEDACPEVAGLEEFNGCPDTDGDGVKDSEDACPNVAGLVVMNGCPDADSDGIADKDDMCPNAKGTKVNKGCPDADGDGIVDKDDKCPAIAGPVENAGCPWPDTDGDGVLDKDDKCPAIAGIASEAGCLAPVIPKEEEIIIEKISKTILFKTGKYFLESELTKKLDSIIGILNKYPKANFVIEGHADSRGEASKNLKLSEKRAEFVLNYLMSKGIEASRLSTKGYGEDRPVDTNETKLGRANNRRIEIKEKN